ncbi:hypothetical protein D9M68_774800 [compost metagenome]
MTTLVWIHLVDRGRGCTDQAPGIIPLGIRYAGGEQCLVDCLLDKAVLPPLLEGCMARAGSSSQAELIRRGFDREVVVQSWRDQSNKARVGWVVADIQQMVIVALAGCSYPGPRALQLAGRILEQHRQGRHAPVRTARHLNPSVAGQCIVGRLEDF